MRGDNSQHQLLSLLFLKVVNLSNGHYLSEDRNYVVIAAQTTADYKIVCYYGAWSVYRPTPANFGVANIDPFSCTHLIYSFAGLDQDSLTIVSLDAAEDIVKGKTGDSYVLIGPKICRTGLMMPLEKLYN